MRINYVFRGVLAAAMLCMAPAALLATPKAVLPETRTMAVHQAGSQNHTWVLLQQIQREAIHARNNAEQLQMLARNPLVDWVDESSVLERVRDDANKMNKLLFDVRENEAKASPLQRRVIALMAPPSVELADTTQDAIVTLKNHKADVYMTDLNGLAKDIYKEANRADQAVGNVDKYLNARREELQLKQSLGLKKNS